MAEKMERWLVQMVVPEGTFDGADDFITELSMLVEGDSEIEVVSVEIDPDQRMDESKC